MGNLVLMRFGGTFQIQCTYKCVCVCVCLCVRVKCVRLANPNVYSSLFQRLLIDDTVYLMKFITQNSMFIKGGTQAKGICKQDPEANI